MQVMLPPDLEQFVRDLVAAGNCESPNEVVLQSLLLLRDHVELHRIRHEQLRKDVAVGLEQANRGELLDGAEVFARLRKRIEQHGAVS